MPALMKLIAVGRLGSGAEADLCAQYHTRLGNSLDIIEIDDRKAPARDRKAWEAERILKHCPPSCQLIALDEHGKTMTSRKFATWMGQQKDEGADIAFIIGGPDGLDEKILNRARLKLAFGAMTWPHKLVRVLVMEQIYRASTILTGHPYHRD